MIHADDRIALPAGVELRDGCLHDVVRVIGVPLNATARVTVAAASPREAATSLADTFGIDRHVALADVVGFCADLNARWLLDVRPRRGRLVFLLRWCAALPVLLPLGRTPRLPATRRPVDTSNAVRLARTAGGALVPLALAVLVVGGVAAALLLGALGVVAPAFALAVGAAVAGSLVVHEVGHLAALRGIPACVVSRGLRVAVAHRPVPPVRLKIVAAAGPGSGLAASACLLALVSVSHSAPLATAALVSLVNALGLTVLSRDGRTLCASR